MGIGCPRFGDRQCACPIRDQREHVSGQCRRAHGSLAGLWSADLIKDADRQAVAASFAKVLPIRNEVADQFYRRLFELRPEYRSLFGTDTRVKKQKRTFMKTLGALVEAMAWQPDDWRDEVDVDEDPCLILLALGKRHQRMYKIPAEAFEPFGEALLWALSEALGSEMSPTDLEAWTRVYRVFALTMRMGPGTNVELDLGERF